MKINWKEQTKDNILAYSVSGIIIASFCFIIKYWDSTSAFLSKVGTTLLPFILGFCIAFILLPLKKMIEEKWLKNVKWKPGTKKAVSVTLSMVVLFLVIGSFFAVLTPQLIQSFQTLASSMTGYLNSAEEFLRSYVGNNPELGDLLESILSKVQNLVTNWLTDTAGLIPTVLSYSVSVVTWIFDFFIGLIIAIYMLMDKDKFSLQAKKILYADLKKETADYWLYVGRLTSHMFNRFIFGKALDSLIIGLACWIIISIMQIPYAPLISFIIGLTNMIPVFGPFIGAIPCIFILLIINPVKAVEFGIFILILQQIDGNILGPYILGDSVGLPTLWVMFAIIVGGSLFGIIGMFIGVPVFSVIYVLVRDRISSRLKKKNITVE